MRSFTALATVSLLALATALPEPMVKRDDASCMTQAQAQTVADNFEELIAAYTLQGTTEYLAVDYTDNTDSVSTLINAGCAGPQVLGEPTFTSRAAFQAAQGAQPNIPFEQLNVWYNCNTVFLRWRTALEPESVTGIIIGEVIANTNSSSNQPWLIETLYSEFNSGAWLVDVGSFVPTCSSSSSSSSKRSLRA